MTINGTLVISKTPPLIAKEGVVWMDTSTQIPRIKYFSGGGYIPLDDIIESPTWDSLEGKPEVIASGTTQAEARSAIGAGTGNSNLEIGTTASTAKAGNYQPTWAQVTGKPSTFAPEIGDTASTAAAGNHDHAVTAHVDSGLDAASNIQALAQALSARIKALEDAMDTP